MTNDQQTAARRPGTPGAFSLWMQRTMNRRMNRKIRSGGTTFMGMDVLILHTVGRRSGEPRQSPLAWFDDAAGHRLVLGSGGGSAHPGWFHNLLAHPDSAWIELPGDGRRVPVRPQVLEGAEREEAWRRITAAHPRFLKYQSRSARQYPVVRLVGA